MSSEAPTGEAAAAPAAEEVDASSDSNAPDINALRTLFTGLETPPTATESNANLFQYILTEAPLDIVHKVFDACSGVAVDSTVINSNLLIVLKYKDTINRAEIL